MAGLTHSFTFPRSDQKYTTPKVGLSSAAILPQIVTSTFITLLQSVHWLIPSTSPSLPHRTFFGQVGNELGLLVSVLNATEEHAQKVPPDNAQLPELNEALNRCHDVLCDLSRLKEHFDNVGPQTQVTWERMGWGVDELVDIRAKLLLYIQVLNVLNTNMIRSSHENVERMLKTFISEIRSGKRESSVMSTVSTSSLSVDEKEGWRQLRKELQSIGITPEIFSLNRKLILTSLQALSQNEGEDYHINLATVNLGQGDSSPGMLRELTDTSDSSSGAAIEDEIPVTTAADTDLYLPEETLNVEPQLPTDNQGTTPILASGKKFNRVARLLYRLTHPNADLMKAAQDGNLDEAKTIKNVVSSSQATKTADTQKCTSPPQLNLHTASPFDGTIILSNKKNDRDSPIDQFSGFSSAMPISTAPDATGVLDHNAHATGKPTILFVATSIYEFNTDSIKSEAGYPYLIYGYGQTFSVIAEKGELWLAFHQEDSEYHVGWIWHMHFAKIP